MVDPRKQDLYLLQNEHGLIKIGRSVDVSERVRKLRSSERCIIECVFRFKRSGHEEEGSHWALSRYRVHGEWFCGSDEARAAIESEFGLTDVDWPFAHDPEASARWLAQMKGAQPIRRLKRAISREATVLRSLRAPSGNADVNIFILLSDPLLQAVAPMEVHLVDGRLTRLHRDAMSGALRPIPAYTSDVAAALAIWPNEARPQEWVGSPLECCIAGLSALNSSI